MEKELNHFLKKLLVVVLDHGGASCKDQREIRDEAVIENFLVAKFRR